MMSRNIMELCWTQIEELDKEKTVMIIGIAPIEEHGRHLPTGVDVYETKHWIERSISKLENSFPEYTFLTMPMIPFGHGDIRGFVGNIHLSQKLIYQIVLEMLGGIAEWGIKNIGIISGHADPKHLIAIEQACDEINKIYQDISFAPMGAIFSQDNITLDFKDDSNQLVKEKLCKYPNDFHGGWIETSNMLDICPGLVNDNYGNLPDISINEMEMIQPEIVSSKIKGQGHIGYPKESTMELGQVLNENMAERIKICVEAYLIRKDYKKYSHHKLYNIPALKVQGGK